MPAGTYSRETPATQEAQTDRVEGGRDWWWLAAILLLALVLRLHDLEQTDIWVDEANGILTAQSSFGEILRKLSRDSSPPLYYFLLHGWIAIFGDSAAAVRSLSLGFALLLIGTVYTIGTREISHRAGCWAAFLLAISPSQIEFSQQARMYTLLPLVAILAWWFLLRNLRSGHWRDFAACMASTSVALYTHNFGVYVPVVLAAMVLLSGQLFRHFWRWLLAVVIQAVLYAPWIPTLLVQIENRDHYAWFQGLWWKFGTIGVIERSFRSFAPGGVFVMSPSGEDGLQYGIPAGVAFALAVSGAVLLARRWREKGVVGALWIPVALALPMAAALSLSQFLTPHYVPGRVDQMLLPAYALLAATAIAALKPRKLRYAIALVFFCVSLIPIDVLVEADRSRYVTKGADKAMVEAVLKFWKPEDVILCTSLTRAPVEYYLQRAGVEAKLLSFPRETARHLGAQNDRRLIQDTEALKREAATVLQEARRLAGPDGNLFILRSDMKVNVPLLTANLRRRHYIYREVILGFFDQTGTGETIEASLFRVHALDSQDDGP